MSFIRTSPASTARPLPDSPEIAAMAAEIRQTLTAQPPWIPSKYLYDDRGSRLFDEITRVPEYYPTRTEERLLESVAGEIVEAIDPVEILELGSGVGRKIRALLDRVLERRHEAHVVFVDINRRVIAESVAELRAAYPHVDVAGSVADFEREPSRAPRRGRRLTVFFAGTIGNLHPDSVPSFLRRQAQVLEPGDGFLVGVDLVKDRRRLEAAYNDARGVTAEFNRNILRVINARLGADFDPGGFAHVAFFDEERSWIEMRLRAQRAMHVEIPAAQLEMTLSAGDEIRTEISCKYTRSSFEERVAGTGFALRQWLTDPESLFALALLVRTERVSPSPWKSPRRVLTSLEAAWRRSDALFDLLAREALLAQPIALRQPFLFYVGHLPAFAWNQVGRGVLGRPASHAAFDALFERGIDPVGVDRYEAAGVWPPLDEVLAYRDRVRAELRRMPDDVEARANVDDLAARGRIFALVVEHERMHHETLLYMIQRLPAAQKRRPRDWPAPRFGRGRASTRVVVPPGRATLGAAFETLPFGWDNEFPEHRLDVPAFAIDSCAVTNGAWAAFVEAGGYEARRLWTDEDWAWKERAGVRAPAFWSGEPGRWRYRGLFDEWPLGDVEDWPVYVSAAEARAYTTSLQARLPTEAEFHRAAFGTPEGAERAWPWGDAPPDGERGNFGFRHGGPTPVGAFPLGASAWGLHDLAGNGWEWTATPFAPFPGFAPYIRTYAGYSQDFFDGAHFVLKGASWATDDVFLRRSFRNWFQPHYPYVFAKFRCVYSA